MTAIISPGDIVEIQFWDHEEEDGVDHDLAIKKDLEPVKVWGKYIGETPDTIILANWDSKSTADNYRIIKNTIINMRVLI